MKEKFQEILDDLVGRFRNPLITSFILVWLYFHWSLLYQIFSFDEQLNYQQKLFLVKLYVKQMGWQGMIGNPIVWAFASLILYYLIGIVAQFLRILLGKRLYAWVLLQFDTGKFVEKSELIAEKKKRKDLQTELDTTKDSHSRLINEKNRIETDLSSLRENFGSIQNQLKETQNNVLFNTRFIENKENLLLYLLSRVENLSGVDFQSKNLQYKRFDVIEGTWSCHAGTRLQKETGRFTSYIFDRNEMLNSDGKNAAMVEELIYDAGLGLLNFKLNHTNKEHIEQFRLIYISKDEFIGFRDNEIVSIKRAKIN